jgi:hypothetical protein
MTYVYINIYIRYLQVLEAGKQAPVAFSLEYFWLGHPNRSNRPSTSRKRGSKVQNVFS